MIEQRKVTTDQLREMHIDKRAWISPAEMSMKQIWGAGDIPDDYIDISIKMANTGREPATNVSLMLEPAVFDYSVIQRLGDQSLDLQTGDVPLLKENNSCSNIHPFATGMTIYPSVGAGFGIQNTIQNSLRFTAWKTIPDMVQETISAKTIIYFNGCLTYNTVGETHRSKFCQYIRLENGRLSDPPFRYCPAGNEAD